MYPYCVDGGQGFHFVIKVKELVSVHEYPEPLVLAVDLNLEDRCRERQRKQNRKKEGKKRSETNLLARNIYTQ